MLAVQGLWAGRWLSDVDGVARPQVVSQLAAMGMVLIVAAPLWGVLTHHVRQVRGTRRRRGFYLHPNRRLTYEDW